MDNRGRTHLADRIKAMEMLFEALQHLGSVGGLNLTGPVKAGMDGDIFAIFLEIGIEFDAREVIHHKDNPMALVNMIRSRCIHNLIGITEDLKSRLR